MSRVNDWVRLERETPARGQAGCAFGIGAFLTAFGAIIVLFMRGPGKGRGDWLVYVVGGGFALVGAVMVVLALKMVLATRTPETIVEVDGHPVSSGGSLTVRLTQPGPVRLESLRANLVCEQTTELEVGRSGKQRPTFDRRIVYQENVLEVRDRDAARGGTVQAEGVVQIPADVSPSGAHGKGMTTWRLEVWGKVKGWAGFMHPFLITVRPGATNPRGRQAVG